MEVPAPPVVSKRRSLSGSMIGGIAETQEMLDFCAEHGVRARDRGNRAGLHQRGLRAGVGQRRAVPLRHRHRVTAAANSPAASIPASGQPAAASLAATR